MNFFPRHLLRKPKFHTHFDIVDIPVRSRSEERIREGSALNLRRRVAHTPPVREAVHVDTQLHGPHGVAEAPPEAAPRPDLRGNTPGSRMELPPRNHGSRPSRGAAPLVTVLLARGPAASEAWQTSRCPRDDVTTGGGRSAWGPRRKRRSRGQDTARGLGRARGHLNRRQSH